MKDFNNNIANYDKSAERKINTFKLDAVTIDVFEFSLKINWNPEDYLVSIWRFIIMN